MSVAQHEIPAEVERIGFFSDVHGTFDRVLQLKESCPDIDHWFCCGDVVDMFRPRHHNEPTIRLMRRLAIPAVVGNHDRRYSRLPTFTDLDETNQEWLRDLPRSLRIGFGRLEVEVYHATPSSLEEFVTDRASDAALRRHFASCAADVIVLGHTHVSFCRELGRSTFVNPGALGVPGLPSSYALLNRTGQVDILQQD